MCFLHRRILAVLFALTVFFAFSSQIWSVALSPDLVEKLRKEGKLEEWAQKAQEMAARGVWAPNPNPPVLRASKGETAQDTLKPLVLCIDFSDNVASHDTSQFSFLLFSKGYSLATGSFRDYYLENSYNTLDVNGAVYGWVRVSKSYSYYVGDDYGTGAYPTNCQYLVEEALSLIDPYVNFHQFDYDNDGWIDGLIVVHAGPGAEETGSTGDIWSHEWSMHATQTHDGVHMLKYTINPEVHPGGGLIEIGVFCHEFGHFLGAVDLYDYGYDSEGAGKWSVMASGSYNNGSRTPAEFDAYHKKLLGFVSPTWVQANQTGVDIPQVETDPVIYRLAKAGYLGNEYFLVENRQKTGFDTYLPYEGLLIWHVDEAVSPTSGHPNDYQWCPGSPATPHYRVALEQADGKFELEGCPGYMNEGNAGDPFPGIYGKTAFDDTTTPSSRGYPDTSTQVAVWNISSSDSLMHANLDVLWSRPCAVMNSFTIDDAYGGDGDGRPEPGETVRIFFTVSNLWLPLTGVSVTASADTAGIIFTDDYSYLGNMAQGGSANNYSDPIVFQVAPNFPGRPTVFTLHLQGNGGAYTRDFLEQIWAGAALVLLVDDAGAYQSDYTTVLDSMLVLHDVWQAYGKADPDFSFRIYPYMIWFTGDYQADPFTQAQVDSLISFLDGGGRLFLTSQDAVEALAGSANPSYQELLTDYLHVGYDGNNSDLLVLNQPGDEIGNNLWLYPGGPDSPGNQTSKDNLIPDAQADTVLRYAAIWWEPTGNIAATKFASDFYRVVVFGFGFEGLNTSGQVYYGHKINTPYEVMQTVLGWLMAPGPSLSVMNPNGGEDWLVDSTYCIQWQSVSFNGQVGIQYSTDAGASWSAVVETTANDGEYCWTVPDTPSDSCLIAISDVENGIPADTSDGYFRILNYIDVLAPNGGEAWFVGNTYDILWYSVSTKDSVKIEFSLDAGAAWSAIAETTTNDGAYSWTVPDTTSDSCLIRISDVVDGTPVDQSDAVFRIINYVAGDANGDMTVSVADAIYLLNYLFKAGDPPDPMAAADANGDCVVNVGDAIYILNYLFKAGDPPKPGCA